jgi:DNA-binding transcriptional ArsR family regulator
VVTRDGTRPNDTARRVLRVLAHGRANVHHVCQQSGLGDEAAERLLASPGADGPVTQVDRGLYSIAPDGLDAHDCEYPAEAGFLQGAAVVHDAPAVKTVRLRGDRRVVEVQVDEESVTKLAGALREVLADTHGEHPAVPALETFVAADGSG